MDISVEDLKEAISIRRRIDELEKRLALILRGDAHPKTARLKPARYFSPATRAKLSGAARARWARFGAGRKHTPFKKKAPRGSGDTGPKMTE